MATFFRMPSAPISIIVVTLLTASLHFSCSTPALAATDTSAIPVKQVNHTDYVKLSDVLNAFGGQFGKDSATRKLVYTPVNLSKLIASVAPSVVGIIGNYETSSKADRFNLAHGTGFVIKEDGWIATNAHVVADMNSILVVTNDGKQYDGVLKGIDEDSDLALLKIKAKKMKPVIFAKQEPKTGDSVFAVGTPISFSLRNSVTTGVISGTNRSVESNYRMIQTDTAINPGNSGGPLLNMKGEVVGVNSMKLADAEIDNLGFAIPSATAKRIISLLISEGQVKHPALGFDLEESFEALVGLPAVMPMTVSFVQENSQAASLGIAPGDELMSVNGKSVYTMVDLKEILLYLKPGQTIPIKIRTNSQTRTLKITLTTAEK